MSKAGLVTMGPFQTLEWYQRPHQRRAIPCYLQAFFSSKEVVHFVKERAHLCIPYCANSDICLEGYVRVSHTTTVDQGMGVRKKSSQDLTPQTEISNPGITASQNQSTQWGLLFVIPLHIQKRNLWCVKVRLYAWEASLPSLPRCPLAHVLLLNLNTQ